MLPAQQGRWQDPRIGGILLMVFLVGAVSGALTMQFGLHGRLHSFAARRIDPRPVPVTCERLKQELNLTPDQAKKIKSILNDMVTYRRDIEAQIESFRSTGKHQIMDILTPEQRTRFEELSNQLLDP